PTRRPPRRLALLRIGKGAPRQAARAGARTQPRTRSGSPVPSSVLLGRRSRAEVVPPSVARKYRALSTSRAGVPGKLPDRPPSARPTDSWYPLGPDERRPHASPRGADGSGTAADGLHPRSPGNRVEEAGSDVPGRVPGRGGV